MGLEGQFQAAANRLVSGQAGHGQRRCGALDASVHQIEGKQHDVMAGSELARCHLPGRDGGTKQGMTGYLKRCGHTPFRQTGGQPGHADGGRGPKVMRIDKLQKPLREARKLGIHLQLDAPRQEGKAFQ